MTLTAELRAQECIEAIQGLAARVDALDNTVGTLIGLVIVLLLLVGWLLVDMWTR